MFFAKKLVAAFFYPVPVCLEFLLAGLILLWFSRKQRVGKWLVTIGTTLLLVLAYESIPGYFLERLESRYPPLELATFVQESASPIKWIVVLGGGHSPDPRLPTTSQVKESTLFRLVESIRLHRALSGSTLVLSGGSGFKPVPVADAMASLAQLLGVDGRNLVIERASKDTAEHAEQLQSLIGHDRFILVTSASHMPRAMAMFRRQGMQPVAAPTDYLIMKSQGFHPGSLFPGALGFQFAEVAVHEYLGLLWARVLGQI